MHQNCTSIKCTYLYSISDYFKLWHYDSYLYCKCMWVANTWSWLPIQHYCIEFQSGMCLCLVHSGTCAWASLFCSCSMQHRIRSLSLSPSSFSLSSSSFFLLSSLIPSSSFSLWLFSNWRNSFAPSTGYRERQKWKNKACMNEDTLKWWPEGDGQRRTIFTQDRHQAESRNKPGLERTKTPCLQRETKRD